MQELPNMQLRQSRLLKLLGLYSDIWNVILTTAHGRSGCCLAMVPLATSLPSVGSDATVLAVGGCSDLPPFGRFERHTLRFRTV